MKVNDIIMSSVAAPRARRHQKRSYKMSENNLRDRLDAARASRARLAAATGLLERLLPSPTRDRLLRQHRTALVAARAEVAQMETRWGEAEALLARACKEPAARPGKA